MITEATRLKLADDVTFQSVDADQTVILSLASGYLFTCNGTTASFLAAISAVSPQTFGQAIDQLAAEYDAPREQLLADMADLVARLVEEKLLVVELPSKTSGPA